MKKIVFGVVIFAIVFLFCYAHSQVPRPVKPGQQFVVDVAQTLPTGNYNVLIVDSSNKSLATTLSVSLTQGAIQSGHATVAYRITIDIPICGMHDGNWSLSKINNQTFAKPVTFQVIWPYARSC